MERDYSKITKEWIEEFLEDLKPTMKLDLYVWSDEKNDLIPFEESKQFHEDMVRGWEKEKQKLTE